MSRPAVAMAPPTEAAPDARPPAVVVEGLQRRFGDIEAVRGIDFQVKSGEIFGFLGPNGAGKSTTIKILCTLLVPSGGRASVAGHDVVTDRDEVRRHIGLVFQDTVHDGALTFAVESGEEFVPRLFAELGVPIRSISLSRPSLDDVFMSFTGSTIHDAEATSVDHMRNVARVMTGRRPS